jgi:MHS family proline/betaine transporter-like MFS transporter
MKRVLASSMLGNVLEHYDFALYGVFAGVFARIFFPSSDPTASLIFSWGGFATGLLMRPFGAAIFGHIGDRFGRKKALSLAIVLMGLPTLLIGFLPTYHSIGIIAPLCLIFCRMVQGLSVGGESSGAAIFTLEHLSQRKYRGIVSGLMHTSSSMGAALAMGIGAFMLQPGIPEWGWRLPFILGAFISWLGYVVRYRMQETPTFNALAPQKVKRVPLLEVFHNYKRVSVITVAIGSIHGCLVYTFFGFLSTYLSHHLGMSPYTAMRLNFLGLLVLLFCNPFMGFVFNFSKPKIYFTTMGILIFLLAPVAFMMLQTKQLLSIALGLIILAVLTASITGPQHAFVQQLFPTSCRYSGAAFFSSLGAGICGGLTPVFLTFMISKTGNMLTPAISLMVFSALWLCALQLYRGEKDLYSLHYQEEQTLKKAA